MMEWMATVLLILFVALMAICLTISVMEMVWNRRGVVRQLRLQLLQKERVIEQQRKHIEFYKRGNFHD